MVSFISSLDHSMNMGKNEVLIASLFFLAFVLMFELLKVDVVIHETSHYLVGRFLGGECEMFLYFGGGKTVCFFQRITKSGLALYALGGIIGEVFVSLILLAIPFTSALGGYMFFSIGLSHFLGAYRSDLESIGLEFLLSPIYKIIFLAIGIIVLWLSVFTYVKFFLKYKTKK